MRKGWFFLIFALAATLAFSVRAEDLLLQQTAYVSQLWEKWGDMRVNGDVVVLIRNGPDDTYDNEGHRFVDVGIRFFDLADPRNVQWGDIDLGYFTRSSQWSGPALAIYRDHYLMVDLSPRKIIDFNDIRAPRVVGETSLRGEFCANGDVGYLRDGTSVIGIVDLSDPLNPVAAGSFAASAPVRKVVPAGDVLFLDYGSSQVDIADARDAKNPKIIGTYQSNRSVADLFPSQDLLYVGSPSGEDYEVVDVTVGASPAFRGLSPVARNGGGLLGGLLLDHDSIGIYDLTDPLRPARVGAVPRPPFTTLGEWKIAGNRVYSLSQGVMVYEELSRHEGVRANPQRASSLPITGFPSRSAFRSPHFITAANQSLVIVDLSAPAQARVVGMLELAANALAVQTRGNTAFIATVNGVILADVGRPEKPRRIGALSGETYSDLAILNDELLFLAQPGGGIRVADVSNPDAPSLVGQVATAGRVAALAIGGNRLYVAEYEAEMEVFDLTDPRRPQFIGRREMLEEGILAYDVAVDGAVVCLATDWGIELLDAQKPLEIGRRLFTRSRATGVAFDRHFIYAAIGEGGLDVFQKSNEARLGGNSAFSAGKVTQTGAFVTVTSDDGIHVLRPFPEVSLAIRAGEPRTITVSAPAQLSGRLQRSKDLAKWEDWESIRMLRDSIEKTDADTTAARFYRFVTP